MAVRRAPRGRPCTSTRFGLARRSPETLEQLSPEALERLRALADQRLVGRGEVVTVVP